MSKLHMFRASLPGLLHNSIKTEERRVIPNIRTKMLSDDYLENFIRVYAEYGIGDMLWVREPAKITSVNLIDLTMQYVMAENPPIEIPIPERFYCFDVPNQPVSRKWITDCQGIPNGCLIEMSRTKLEVIDVRIQSVQDITTEEIIREGFDGTDPEEALTWWKSHWDALVKPKYFWENNPKVFVYQLKKITKGK